MNLVTGNWKLETGDRIQELQNGRLDRGWHIAWATNFRLPEAYSEVSDLLLSLFEYAFFSGTSAKS
jgi:hypothetical protein